MLSARLTAREHEEFDDLSQPFRVAKLALENMSREMRQRGGDAGRDLANHLDGVLNDADGFCAIALYDMAVSHDDERKGLELLQDGVKGCPQILGKSA